MIRWMKHKEKDEREISTSGYKIYFRYDERNNQPVQQFAEEPLDWSLLLNDVSCYDDDCVKLLVPNEVYIYNQFLIRYLYAINNIKVLVFDIIALPIENKQSLNKKIFSAANYDDYKLDVDNKEKEIPNVGKILSENLNGEKINV